MEEILASIRRIISEDDKPEGQAKASDDVLELTEVAEEEQKAPAEEPVEEAAAEPAEEPAPAEEAAEESSIDDVLDEVDTDDELELRDESGNAPVAAPPPPAAAFQSADAGLLERQTAAAAVGNLSSLVAAVDRAHGGTTLGDGNRTIEDLLKEVMRPMVKEWLDANLPSLTERLVRREIERLARQAEHD